eukprot:1977722-Karenia_brevis.AAC.1
MRTGCCSVFNSRPCKQCGPSPQPAMHHINQSSQIRCASPIGDGEVRWETPAAKLSSRMR